MFKTKKMQQCFEQSAAATKRWGREVARKYIMRINELYAVSNFQELYGFRSMKLHPLKGSKTGEYSIYLTVRWRLILSKGISEDLVVIREVSNHYGD